MKPYYKDTLCTIYHADCREILPQLNLGGMRWILITDPPYATGNAAVPIRGAGVAKRRVESRSIGQPWGYALDWIECCGQPEHWVVFANYRMLGELCTALPPSSVFVWRKSNAPNMTRPVPRLDCEFIVWSRGASSSCERMGEFRSQIIDVRMLQAGCMAVERFTENGGPATHPCQKPLAVVLPFIQRLGDKLYVDPFMGTGTTLLAAKLIGRRAVGIEAEEKYCELAASRLAQECLALG